MNAQTQIAETIRQQILGTGGIAVVGSWGFNRPAVLPENTHPDHGYCLGGLQFRVNGYVLRRGIVRVWLHGSDTYIVEFGHADRRQPGGIRVRCTFTDIYFDQLAELIDGNVERRNHYTHESLAA